MKWLDGKKTYLGMVALGVWELIGQFGWVDASIMNMGRTVIGTFTGVAIKHAWDKKTK